MAVSASKKKLMHKLRQRGYEGLDPRTMRGRWGKVNPVTQIRPNKRKEPPKYEE